MNTTTETFAELTRKVAFGEAGGRIIWQPRVLCWVDDRVFSGEPFPEPYGGMTLPEIHAHLNCSARPYRDFCLCFKIVEPESVTRTERMLNETDTELTIQTPVGKQVSIMRNTPNSRRDVRVKRLISDEAEMKVAAWLAENSTWEWDQEAYKRGLEKWGGLGAPTINVPRITIQDLYIVTMGVEATIYALCDYPDTVEAYFRALDDFHDRMIDVINPSPIELINFGDNVHCGTLSPDLFKKYVLPSYQRRCEKLHSAGKFVHAHWDGDTKSLLPFARETGLDGIEAITPKPQGDVTLEEIKEGLGDEMFLIDGIAAVLFDDYFPVSALEEFTHKIIDMFAPRLILGISDEISSTGDIERLRAVDNIVNEFNASATE